MKSYSIFINMPNDSEPTNFRENRSEVLLRLMRRLPEVPGITNRNLKEALNTEENRRELIEKINETEFVNLLKAINGILKNKPKETWTSNVVNIPNHTGNKSGVRYAPSPVDKIVLLESSLKAAKRMNAEGRSLEDIGMLLAFGIVETHPFEDGNGRTSRLIYTLISEGFVEESIKNILSPQGRDYININAGAVEEILEKLDLRYLLGPEGTILLRNKDKKELSFSGSLPEKAKTTLLGLLKEYDFHKVLPMSILKWLAESKKTSGDYLEIHKVTTSKGTSIHVEIFLDRIAPMLDEDSLIKIFHNYWNYRKVTAEIVIDCIEHPNDKDYRMRYSNRMGSVFSYIKDDINGMV